MRSILTGGMVLALSLAVLSAPMSLAGPPGPGDAGTPDGGRKSAQRRRAAPPPAAEVDHAGPAAPIPKGPADPCAEFNARPRLSAEEHLRRYGCPPCPCACVHGEIRCAPCAACEGPGKDTDGPAQLATPPPTPPPPPKQPQP